MYNNAMLLGLCQFLLMASVAVGLSFNGLIGQQMASSSALATLPFLTMTGTTALLTLFLPRIVILFGYRWLFIAGAVLGVAGSLFAALGIWLNSFVVFCAAGVLMGVYQASALYYRFAAADSVAQPSNKATAMAWVLNGGILAALLGPLLASSTVHWLAVEYLGSFVAVALLLLLALPVMALMRLPERQATAASNAVSYPQAMSAAGARPAILFCAGGYAMMMLVMLATPLAMHHCGYRPQDAASVIQWHLLGMFVPSLLTGKLIARWGGFRVASAGAVILVAGLIVAFQGVELSHFHWSLMWVGVGWNFMYMGGSTIIAQVKELPVRLRLQSLNEFVTFALMTLTAATTGWLYQALAWAGLLILAAIFISLMVGVLMVDAWQRNKRVTGES